VFKQLQANAVHGTLSDTTENSVTDFAEQNSPPA